MDIKLNSKEKAVVPGKDKPKKQLLHNHDFFSTSFYSYY